jgi:hypothetical protein
MVIIKLLITFKEWQMLVMTMGSFFCMMPYSISGTMWCFSYSVMYYGEKVLGYLGSVHIVVIQCTTHLRN